MKRLGILCFLCALSSALFACNLDMDKKVNRTNEVVMEYEPKVFEQVTQDSFQELACSPKKPSPEWRGISIKMPKTITYSLKDGADKKDKVIVIPICGYYMADYSAMIGSPPMSISVRNRNSGDKYHAGLQQQDPSPEEPDSDEEDIAPADMVGMASGGYFNYNLLNFIILPGGSGHYEVVVDFANMKSNTVIFEIIEK